MSSPKYQSDALEDVIGRQAATDGLFAIAYAILQSAQKLEDIGVHLKYLGNGDAATTQGAIEGLTMAVKEVANQIDSLSSSFVPLTVERYEDIK